MTAESQAPKCLRRLGNKSIKEFEPNKRPTFPIIWKELVYFLWGGVRYDSQESIEKLVSAKQSQQKQVEVTVASIVGST